MDPWNTHRCLYKRFPSTSISTSEDVLNRCWLFRFLRNKIYVYSLIKLSPSSDMANRPLLVNPIFTSLHEDAPESTLWIVRASSLTYLVNLQLHDKLHSSLFVQHSSMTYMASKSVMFAMLQKAPSVSNNILHFTIYLYWWTISLEKSLLVHIHPSIIPDWHEWLTWKVCQFQFSCWGTHRNALFHVTSSTDNFRSAFLNN